MRPSTACAASRHKFVTAAVFLPVCGLQEMPIEAITLSNVRISAAQGFLIRNAKDIRFHDVHIDTQKGPAVYGGNIEQMELSGFRSASPHAGNGNGSKQRDLL